MISAIVQLGRPLPDRTLSDFSRAPCRYPTLRKDIRFACHDYVFIQLHGDQNPMSLYSVRSIAFLSDEGTLGNDIKIRFASQRGLV
jgi:hypothetical protein